MPAVCNLDGNICREQEARISVLDRGFLFGDSVYEVLRTRLGVPFAWQAHWARLEASAEAIGLPLDLDEPTMRDRVRQTLRAAQLDPAYVRIIVTRGRGSAPNIDLSYAPGPSSWILMVRELPPPPSGPGRLAIVPRLRLHPRALDPAIKSGNYLNNLLALAEAKRAGATDCLMLNHDGCVTEASTSNFWLVRAGTILTPPTSAGLLHGITRQCLIEHAARLGVQLIEQDLRPEDCRTADEAFLSSTLRDVLPIVAIDDQPVGNGKPGPVTQKLAATFAEACERLARERDLPLFTDA